MPTFRTHTDAALLLVRIALGLVFIYHGFDKLSAPENFFAFFASIGLGSTMVYAVGSVELLGGIAMILGLFSRIAGILLASVMVGAILLVKLKLGFSGPNGGYELDLTLLLAALAITLGGPGSIIISRLFRKRITPHADVPMQGTPIISA